MTMPGSMTKFRISEISGVTRPAQKGAKAVIMKRADDPPALATAADIALAVRQIGKAADPAVEKARIIAGAEALGVKDQLPEGWVKKAGDTGGTGEDDEMSNVIKKALGLADTATDAEVEAAITKNATEAKTATALAERAIRKAGMSDDEKKHTAKMSDDDADDFMKKPKADRDAAVKKALDGDETLESYGQIIRKSDVGEGVFAVLKGQAAEIATNKASFEKAQEAAKETGFAKRATDEFPHLAGTVSDRTKVLKYLDGADAETKAAAEAILKAAEASSKLAFTKIGAGNGNTDPALGDVSPEAKLKKMAEDRVTASAGAVSFAKAYDDVIQANPALYEEALAAKAQ